MELTREMLQEENAKNNVEGLPRAMSRQLLVNGDATRGDGGFTDPQLDFIVGSWRVERFSGWSQGATDVLKAMVNALPEQKEQLEKTFMEYFMTHKDRFKGD